MLLLPCCVGSKHETKEADCMDTDGNPDGVLCVYRKHICCRRKLWRTGGKRCKLLSEKDDVIQDPALHWAVRAAMNITGEKRKLTKEDVASSYVKYISYEQSSHPENFTGWKE